MAEPSEDVEASRRVLARSNSLVTGVVIPLLIGLALLWLEYRSGLFGVVSEQTASHWDRLLAGLSTFSLLTAMFSWGVATAIRLQNRSHVREEFALASTIAILAAAVLVVCALWTGQMPWSPITRIVGVTLGQSSSTPAARWPEYAFLLLGAAWPASALRRTHRLWYGQRSVDQYRREQRGEPPQIFSEGLSELERVLKGKPPRRIHVDLLPKATLGDLPQAGESLAWKDQAKVLLRLSSTAYSFEEASWHAPLGCWIGRNSLTGGPVLLHPFVGESVGAALVADLKKYGGSLLSHKRPGQLEIVIVSRHELGGQVPLDKNVRVVTEDDLLDTLVDFREYAAEIRRRACSSPLPDASIVLQDVYVQSGCTHSDGRPLAGTAEEQLSAWVAEPGQRHLALLGEYGQGKSSTTLMWAHHVLADQASRRLRIPIIIELRGTSPRNLSPLSFLGAWCANFGINPQALLQLHNAGRLVLIFEGFDEMALIGDSEMRLKHFRALWHFAHPKAKILITGRPNFFLDEEEMKAALGIARPIGDRPYCEALRLSLFDIQQIRRGLRGYSANAAAQIPALAERNQRLRELVSRPSLLHIIATMWEREKLYDKVDSLTSAFVLDLFVRNSYRRQGLKGADSADFMALTSSEREYFMFGIAGFMAAYSLPNQISGDLLSQVVDVLIHQIPDSVSTSVTAMSGENCVPLRIRLQGSQYGRDHVQTDVRACGLLVDDPAAPGAFRFGHKSFMEYLIAAVVAERIQQPKSERASAALNASGAVVEDVLAIPVAVEFLSELLGATPTQDSGEEGEAAQLRVAKQLFSAVVLGTGLLRPFRRAAAWRYAISLGSRAEANPRTKTLVRFGPPATLVIVGAALLATSLGFDQGLAPEGLSRRSSMNLALFLGLIVAMTDFLGLRIGSRRTRLWVRICAMRGISSRTMHRVLGTIWLPVIRDASLDDADERKLLTVTTLRKG